MYQSIKLSLNTKCFLCQSFFDQSVEYYVLYKCFFCKKFTHYCSLCEMKIKNIFGKRNIFKCCYCNKLVNVLDKIEINPIYFKKSLNDSIINNINKTEFININNIIRRQKILKIDNLIGSKYEGIKDKYYINYNIERSKSSEQNKISKMKKIGFNKSFVSKKNESNSSDYFGYNNILDKYYFNGDKKNIINKQPKKNDIIKYKEFKNINSNINLTNTNIELKPEVNNFTIKKCDLKNISLIKNDSYGFPLFFDENIKCSLFIPDLKPDDLEKLNNINDINN